MIRFARPLFVFFAFVLAAPAFADDASRLLRKLGTKRAERVASQLADMGKDALEAIKEGLQHRNWKIRYWSAYAMAYSKAAKDGGGVAALKPLLQDRKNVVRLRAAMALFLLGDKSGLELAKSHAKDESDGMRAEAMAALSVSGDAAVVPLLREALKDEHGKVRYWALLGLRDLGGDGGLQLGLQYAKDDNADVQTAAMELLAKFGQGSFEAQDALIKLLKSRRPPVRQQAASVLARIGTKKAIPALRKVRDGDRSATVREVADAAVVEILKRKK